VNRRKFIVLLGAMGGAPALAPAGLGAQRAAPVVGFLSARSAEPEQGFVDGENVIVEYRWANGHYDRLPSQAADFVERSVLRRLSVRVSSSSQSTHACLTPMSACASPCRRAVGRGFSCKRARPPAPPPSQVSPHGGRASIFEVAHANETDPGRNALRPPALVRQAGWASRAPNPPRPHPVNTDPWHPPCRGLLLYVRPLTAR
jgi:hypothetical protein